MENVKKTEKYTAIINHNHKTKIDGWLVGGISYRDVSKKIQDDLGGKISYQTLRRYHKDILGGVVLGGDDDDGGGDLGGNLPPLPSSMIIDVEQTQRIIDDLGGDDNFNLFDLKAKMKKYLFEIYALQTQITLQGIKQHIDGGCRYPSEYVSKLSTIFGLLVK